MNDKERLPYRILNKACGLFAGATGLSYRQMEEFFCYELNKRREEVALPTASNRSEAFQNWLSLFSLSRQKALLLRLCREDLSMWHGRPVKADLDALARSLTGFAVDEAVGDTLGQVNCEMLTECWKKALERRTTDPEGAITTARSLIETACKHILDDAEQAYSTKVDLPKLYRLTAKRLNLAPDQHTEEIFKRILEGCVSVVEGLGAIRNKMSDAHGKGRARLKSAPRHAELAVNLAGAMAIFLLATWDARRSNSTQQRRVH